MLGRDWMRRFEGMDDSYIYTVYLSRNRVDANLASLHVVDLPDEYRDRLVELLTFDTYMHSDVIVDRSHQVVDLLNEYTPHDRKLQRSLKVLVDCESFFSGVLEAELVAMGYRPLFIQRLGEEIHFIQSPILRVLKKQYLEGCDLVEPQQRLDQLGELHRWDVDRGS